KGYHLVQLPSRLAELYLTEGRPARQTLLGQEQGPFRIEHSPAVNLIDAVRQACQVRTRLLRQLSREVVEDQQLLRGNQPLHQLSLVRSLARRLDPGGPGVQLGANAFLRGQIALDVQCCFAANEAQAEPPLLVALEVALDALPKTREELQQGGGIGFNGIGSEDAIVPAHRRYPFLRGPYLGTSGSPTTASSCWMMSSLVLPSACAWKLALMRWRRTGMATLRMSSMATLKRPSIAAIALPPWRRNCPARGPAPQSTIFRTKSGAAGSRGRVARTSRSA